MILTPSLPSLARWCAVVSRTASAMRGGDIIVFAGAASVGIVTSVILAPDLRGILGAGLAVLMIAVAAADARRFIIPDELSAAALALGLVYAAMEDTEVWAQALAWSALRGATSALIFLGVRILYRRLRGRDGIGLGDVKLAGVAGVWLDWSFIPIAIEIAAVAALGAYLIRHFYFRRAIRPTTRMPFGLFLAPAIWISWLLERILLLYPSATSF
ncbi:MAG TPA: A24 family peptidase [Xanthobacteraceae bacterium]|nr:A24 family peptidase [Xanthobacteraceae bacterium]